VFRLLERLGDVPKGDFRRTFNTGVGMVAVVPARRLAQAERVLEGAREDFFQVGKVIELAPRARKRVIYR
jgi:phosphoribosylformylglycinamidine cyclo-ligase